ncbi:hypothetical protein BDW67DRAFT_18622 [Aspergillus spinulosporus]
MMTSYRCGLQLAACRNDEASRLHTGCGGSSKLDVKQAKFVNSEPYSRLEHASKDYITKTRISGLPHLAKASPIGFVQWRKHLIKPSKVYGIVYGLAWVAIRTSSRHGWI